MNRLGQLRQLRHQQWLAQLRQGLEAVVLADEHLDRQRPDQIYLFGSRARGDWDGLSDTDLLVVAATQAGADDWANSVMESGLAEDVISLTRQAWSELPNSPSLIWRRVAQDAQPLLGHDQWMRVRMHGCIKLSKTWPWLSSPETTAFRQPPAFTPPRPQKKL